MEIADILLEIRRKEKLTQTELAQRLGVAYASVNRWENHFCLPGRRRREDILTLAHKLGVMKTHRPKDPLAARIDLLEKRIARLESLLTNAG